MPRLPAICTKCGNLFQSGFAFEGPGIIQTENCSSGPCPFCGEMGTVPDGVYSVLTKTALIFTSGVVVKNQLEQFVQTLKTSIQAKTESEELSKQIKKEHPELSSIADALPKTRNELYLFLTLLVTLVTLIINTCKSKNSAPEINQTNINYYINQAIEETNKSIPKQNQNKTENKIKKNPNTKKLKNKKRIRNKIASKSRKKNRKA